MYDTHTAYPMLAMFRSRQPGQHWLTGLAVVMDAAALALAMFDNNPAGPAARVWRRSTKMVRNFRRLPAVGLGAVGVGPGADKGGVRKVSKSMGRIGNHNQHREKAGDSYRRLREAFYPELAAATRLLLVPMEFRHQTSRLDLSSPPGR